MVPVPLLWLIPWFITPVWLLPIMLWLTPWSTLLLLWLLLFLPLLTPTKT
jgi:hypothetical protein